MPIGGTALMSETLPEVSAADGVDDSCKLDAQLYDSSLLVACQQIPKVELHAHLNGCVRPQTIR